jgi:signal transduction histidine kinase
VVRGAVRLPRWRVDPVWVDRALTMLLVVVALAAIWFGPDDQDHRLLGSVVSLAVVVPVAWRRRFPTLVGVWVPLVSTAEFAFLPATSIAHPAANFLAMYGLAVWSPTRRFAAALAGIAIGTVLLGLVSEGGPWEALPYLTATSAAMVLVRRVIGGREERARLAERERDVAAREAVLEERSRIARELHDVIAHSVSMIVVQAGAERRILPDQQGGTYETLAAIERTGRSALTEMRRLVGMLRSQSEDPLTPQPGLSDLAALVDQVRAAGLQVELDVEGEQAALPAGVELSAYRIVQEALTNALKHAGHATARVRLHYHPESLEIDVLDSGTGCPPTSTPSGHGLAGMRERVALYGGRFTAGRRPEGGFAVHVALPVR